MAEKKDWDEIVALIESVSSTPRVLTEAVDDVRATSRALATLDPADIARRTRDLLTAATRAIAARRGPSEAELAFVEDLAVTRARQGIPIAEVLAAIHVASRRIWAETGTLAQQLGVDSTLLFQARELYEDWAESVRQRLLEAHRVAEATARRSHPDREDETVRRLLQGGSAAVLAAGEVGLDADSVHVGVVPDVDALGWVRSWVRRSAVVGVDDGTVVLVTSRVPREAPRGGATVGLAGPADIREVPQLRRLAAVAATAGGTLGRAGVVHVAEVAPLAAILERPDLAASLVAHQAEALATLGPHRDAVVDTVRLWLEAGRDATAAARSAYVHPNTVRNRVAALCAATGLDPTDTFEAVALWWLCREASSTA